MSRARRFMPRTVRHACVHAALLLAASLTGCGDGPRHAYAAPPAGEVERGRLLLRQFGCGGCHRIPGVAGARGQVGPPLEGLAHRAYLGGVLPNTPENLARWIADPRAYEPETVMPDMQASPAQIEDMVAYLYTLE